MTLNAAYERYMSGKINLKHSTKVNYNYMYDLVIRDTLGKRKVNKICFSELKSVLLLISCKCRSDLRCAV